MADAQDVMQNGAEEFQGKPKGVKLKDSAISAESDESPEDRKKRLNISDLPYHTYQTEQIAKKAPENDPDKPYAFEANGYKVEEVKSAHKDLPDQYFVSSGDFRRLATSKADAENFCLTHSAAHKDLPATVPSN